MGPHQNTNPDKQRAEQSALVTVGTTKFDILIQNIDTLEFTDALIARGYTRLRVQAGKSTYTPRHILPKNVQSNQLSNGLSIEWYEYVPSLAPLLDEASLIISHAGSGSLFEALRQDTSTTTVIAVPNCTLMDNHQQELAEKLAKDKHLFVATPETLVHVLKTMDVRDIVPYDPGDGVDIVERIDAVCGVARRR